MRTAIWICRQNRIGLIRRQLSSRRRDLPRLQRALNIGDIYQILVDTSLCRDCRSPAFGGELLALAVVGDSFRERSCERNRADDSPGGGP